MGRPAKPNLSAASSTPKASSPARRSTRLSAGVTRSANRPSRLRNSKVVDDSCDDDRLSEPESVEPRPRPAVSKQPPRTSRQFAGVIIDNSGSSKASPTTSIASRTRRGNKAWDSASSLEIGAMSTRDNSADYETPATSASITPATGGSEKHRPNFGSMSLSESLANNTKRKRQTNGYHVDDDDTLGDEELARRLQEEEYQDVGAKRPKMNSSASKKNDFDVPDSELDEEEDDEEDKASTLLDKAKSKKHKQPAKRGKREAIVLDPDVDMDVLLSDGSEFEESDDDDDLSSAESDEAEFIEGRSGTKRRSNGGSALPARPAPATYTIDDARAREDLNVIVASRMAADYRDNGYEWDPVARRKKRERIKLETAHPGLNSMWDDLEKVPIIPTEKAKQPASISRKLKGFQLEGLNWMIKQEKTQYKGGLLGDEMGMGKTIQAVSLIMSDYPAKNPTLVVVPPVALMQWSNEIGEYTDGKLKVLVYHSTNTKTKKMTVKELKKFDVIMVSYNSLESLHRKETKGWSRGEDLVKEMSPLHAIHFHRLILDEAHSIKQRTTGVAKACFALKGTYKWCLSGTPVQNRIGEFFSLIRFLGIRPFADYFCKRCKCAQIHWSLDKDYRCSYCKHSGSEHVSVFNQELLNPITGYDAEAREEALDKLHLITSRIMLRRVKRDHTSSMELPAKEIVLRNEFFGEIERDFSSSIMTNSSRQFDTYVSRGVMLNNYANIFGLIMQMRQVADHPDLLLKKHAEDGQNVLVCNICDEPAEGAIRSRCKHEFCRSCVLSYVETCEGNDSSADCPRCHIALEIDLDQPDIEQDTDLVHSNSIINRIKMENWTSSTKIEMLIYDLFQLRSKKQTLKSIVFSQFTSMLQLIEWRLRRAGFNTVMLDGSMSPAQRQKSIEYFMNNADVEVFLVSLKAGGVALNLTEASRVFIVDPWWNPAAEWQSADRCHRIGQKRPCVITRLCIEDSVESRMVMLQEKKANMINSTINHDKVAMDKLSPEDLQFLFRGT